MRKPSGDLSRGNERDNATAKRISARTAMMAGVAALSPDFPLSILLARGVIDSDMHDAGMSFAALYARAVRNPHPRGAPWARLLGDDSRAAPSTKRDVRAEAEYARAIAELRALKRGALAVAIVVRLAVFLEPDWFVSDAIAGRTGNLRFRERKAVLRGALSMLAILDPIVLSEIDINPLRIRSRGEPAPPVAIAAAVARALR